MTAMTSEKARSTGEPMTARDDYPTAASLDRHNGTLSVELRAMFDEITASRDVLDRARSYAHACGLFAGGSEMPNYAAIVDLLQRTVDDADA
jgi:hypothetical protein